MVASEPNIKSLSKNFHLYSVPAKKGLVNNVSQDFIKGLKDKVKKLKQAFKEKEERGEDMISLLEQMTWVSSRDEESLDLVKEVLKEAKTYIAIEFEFIAVVKPIVAYGLLKKEYNQYLNLIDDLRETVQDVESSFFFLANDKEFNDSLKELESL